MRTGSLIGNVHVVDNGDRPGAPETAGAIPPCRVIGGQVVNWLALGIDWRSPTYQVFVADVRGEAVDKRVLFPKIYDSPALVGRGYWWGATVDAAVPGVYEYTLALKLGASLTLDQKLHLDVRDDFTMAEPFETPSPG